MSCCPESIWYISRAPMILKKLMLNKTFYVCIYNFKKKRTPKDIYFFNPEDNYKNNFGSHMSRITSYCGFYPLQLLGHDRCSINVCPDNWTELSSSFKSHPALEGHPQDKKRPTGGIVKLKLKFHALLISSLFIKFQLWPCLWTTVICETVTSLF